MIPFWQRTDGKSHCFGNGRRMIGCSKRVLTDGRIKRLNDEWNRDIDGSDNKDGSAPTDFEIGYIGELCWLLDDYIEPSRQQCAEYQGDPSWSNHIYIVRFGGFLVAGFTFRKLLQVSENYTGDQQCISRPRHRLTTSSNFIEYTSNNLVFSKRSQTFMSVRML